MYAHDGRIAAVTSQREPARQRIDATGLLVMPGMVDAHVHLMDPAALEREDFPTGTAAAARAGVTTIIEHTHGGPVRDSADLAEKRSYLRDRSRIDFALAAHAWPDRLAAIESLWHDGAAFFKAFTCTTHGVPGFDAAHLLALFEQVAATDAVCLVHCEDESITAEAERSLRQAGRMDAAVIPAWRSRDAELTALATTTLLARLSGALVVLAHVSGPKALALVARERLAGARVSAETCPQYRTLTEDEILEHGPCRKFTPPARARSAGELDAMWRALAEGEIEYVATDHAPSTPAQKREGSIWDVHFGLPGIDTTLAVLLDAAHRGRLSYERVVEAYAEMPARRYGLFPRKGRIAPGSDADVVLVDADACWTVRDDDIVSRAGWSPFSGRTFIGRAVRTFLRGRLVAEDGEVLAPPGTGQFLPGRGARDRR